MDGRCEDNGLIIEFPDENCSKIDDNEYFRKFSSVFNNFKVMDCSWLDTKSNKLWLIELKRYYNPDNDKYISADLSDKNVISKKIVELLQKTIGTLLLLNDRFETMDIFPKAISPETKVNIVHILKVKPEHKEYLQFMTDKLKAKFDDFPLNANSLFIIDYEMVSDLLGFKTGE